MQILKLEDVLEENTLYSFYGVHGNEFKLGDLVFEAIDDPNDGYRSYLESIHIVNSNSVFPKKPLVNVVIINEDNIMWKFIDESGHIWLEIGTNYTDIYYPYFIFNYDPNKNVTEYAERLDSLDHLNPFVLHAEKLI